MPNNNNEDEPKMKPTVIPGEIIWDVTCGGVQHYQIKLEGIEAALEDGDKAGCYHVVVHNEVGDYLIGTLSLRSGVYEYVDKLFEVQRFGC